MYCPCFQLPVAHLAVMLINPDGTSTVICSLVNDNFDSFVTGKIKFICALMQHLQILDLNYL
jgi:hypothetical protein